MADDQVGTPLVVQIAGNESASDVSRTKVGTTLKADVTELGVALVAQQYRQLLQTRFSRRANNVAVRHDKILPTMKVEVEETGTEADVLLADRGDAGCRRAE